MALVLIVEDDEPLARVMRRSLESLGHEVVQASDGKSALDHFFKREFDLVVTDILMPEKDGLELIPQIRKTKPGVRMLAVSGGGQVGPNSYLVAAKALGAHETLAKPFSMEDFQAVATRVLNMPPKKV
jgi:DNA-binding NtrC family response regulator